MTIPWWKKANFYEVYIKSFLSKNNSSVGDIQGIIEKLDYLKLLGIDAIWVTPFYPSPQNDNGYDITDYCGIDSNYGCMKDFEELVNKAHKKNIKVIIDIVFNHTSIYHKWFSEHEDWYIYKPTKEATNNWVSKFGGSAWEVNPKNKKYYLHLFDKTQADLNWENKELRGELYKILSFWKDKGVDGFRLDVINLIAKHSDYPNDTKSSEHEKGKPFYTNQPKLHKYLKEIRSHVGDDFLLIGELSSCKLNDFNRLTSEQQKELNMGFTFHHLKLDYKNNEKWNNQTWKVEDLVEHFTKWQEGTQKSNSWMALFVNNHDQPRSLSRFGDEKQPFLSASSLAIAIYSLKGSVFIYQGEEIAMRNTSFNSIENYGDVESKNAYKYLLSKGHSQQSALSIIAQKSRDNARVPMAWSNVQNSGFSLNTPWLNIYPFYKENNVELALEDKNSIFYFYKSYLKLRKEHSVFTNGKYKLEYYNDTIWAYWRIDAEEKLFILSALKNKETIYSIPFDINKSKILIHNYNNLIFDDKNNNSIKLRPYESIIFSL